MRTLLWLDDERNPLEKNWLRYSPIQPPYNCVWVKSYTEFVKWIAENDLPDAICFDHDLGMDTEGDIQQVKTGYDCAKWLVEYCLDNHLRVPPYTIQSANPVGKENINGLLVSFASRR